MNSKKTTPSKQPKNISKKEFVERLQAATLEQKIPSEKSKPKPILPSGCWLAINLSLVSIAMLILFPVFFKDLFIKHCCKKGTREPSGELKGIANGAHSWYGEQKNKKNGDPMRRHFPSGISPNKITSGTYINPPQKPCSNGNSQYSKNGKIWDKEPWRSLRFGINKAHYYQYVYIVDNNPKNPSFTVMAHSDLDCDGILSTYRVTAKKAANGEIIRASLVVIEGLE